jgi:ParB family transcriptional regulator, chromosome partitioning protein
MSIQANVTSLPSTPKPQTAKEVIAANVKLLIEQLEAGHSECLTAYLTAMGKFQFLILDTIHESATNPRRTFDESKLHELAESIRQHGLIQPITVRPHSGGFEIVAGARRYRAAMLAELFAVPARIVEIDDAQALEWALVENSQRVDVHPYEEALGFQQLLDIPGYDVATLVDKSGKSASHIYGRLSLLQLIPEVAEAFIQERITASHANLIARIPQESQAAAYAQCWREDWNDSEAHLLPAKFLSAWIQSNLYLSLADAPFDREDRTLNTAAGACTNCPRRSGYNTSLFDDVQGDQCLDGNCYQCKVTAFLDREIAARPELVQIENGWRKPTEQRPGAVRRGTFREIETIVDNPDAEPALPCAAAKPAIIVYGKNIGATLTVCTDEDCPIHDPRAAEEQAANPAPTMAPAPEVETEEEAEVRQRNYEQQRKEYREDQERRAETRRQEDERQQQEDKAECERREKLQKARVAKFERLLDTAPAMFSSNQLRAFLKLLINLDPYAFTDDVAEHFATEHDESDKTSEEILLSALDGLADDKLTGFALRLVLTQHSPIPREAQIDLLVEAEAVFATPKPKKTASKKGKKPTPIKASKSKKTPATKDVAA